MYIMFVQRTFQNIIPGLLALFITILLTPAIATGQGTKSDPVFIFRKGNTDSPPKGFDDIGVCDDTNGGYARLSYRENETLVFQVFDSMAGFSGEHRVDISHFPHGALHVKLEFIGSICYWFIKSKNTETNQHVLWAQRIDVEARKLAGNPVAVIEATGAKGKFISRTSLDKTRLLFVYPFQPDNRDNKVNNEKMGFCVLDSSLIKISSSVFQMPYTEEKMDNKEYLVDNSGNAYLLAKIFEVGRTPSYNNHPNYHYQLHRMKAGSRDLEYFSIPLRSQYYHFLFLTEKHNGDVIVGGLYSRNEHLITNDGIFLMNFSADKFEYFGSGFFDFTSALLRQFHTEYDWKDWNKKTIPGGQARLLVIRNVILNDAGGLDVLGEVYYAETASYSELYFGEIFSMRTDGEGTLKWMKIIHKRQVGVNGPVSLSFNYFMEGGDLYLFYYDDLKNATLADGALPGIYKDGRNASLCCTKIDGRGNVSKWVVEDYSNQKDPVLCIMAGMRFMGNKTLAGKTAQKRKSSLAVIRKK